VESGIRLLAGKCKQRIPAASHAHDTLSNLRTSFIPCLMSLTPSQRRYLRGLAHPLKPVLLLGGKGVTPAVLAELEHALDDHELIKVKLAGGDREERASSLMQLLDASGAENVQTIGHVAVLYRRNDEQPRIALPR